MSHASDKSELIALRDASLLAPLTPEQLSRVLTLIVKLMGFE